MEFHNKWAVDLLKDVSFGYTDLYYCVSKLTLGFYKQVPLCYDIFAKLFHCIVWLSASLFDHVYFSKTTSTNDLDQVEVFEANLLLWLEKVFAVSILIFILV